MSAHTEPSFATEAMGLRFPDLLTFNLGKAAVNPAFIDTCLMWIDGFNAVSTVENIVGTAPLFKDILAPGYPMAAIISGSRAKQHFSK